MKVDVKRLESLGLLWGKLRDHIVIVEPISACDGRTDGHAAYAYIAL